MRVRRQCAAVAVAAIALLSGCGVAGETPGAVRGEGPAGFVGQHTEFRSADGRIGFRLPPGWATREEPLQSTLEGSLLLQVFDGAGREQAVLIANQSLPSWADGDCEPHPYRVIESAELDGFAANIVTRGHDVSPRFVFRVLEAPDGSFAGSLGLTNMVGGLDRAACVLRTLLVNGSGHTKNLVFATQGGITVDDARLRFADEAAIGAYVAGEEYRALREMFLSLRAD